MSSVSPSFLIGLGSLALLLVGVACWVIVRRPPAKPDPMIRRLAPRNATPDPSKPMDIWSPVPYEPVAIRTLKQESAAKMASDIDPAFVAAMKRNLLEDPELDTHFATIPGALKPIDHDLTKFDGQLELGLEVREFAHSDIGSPFGENFPKKK